MDAKGGALSKNRTCDSSLPRTCFTTRLLGQLAKLLTDYTVHHEKIKEKAQNNGTLKIPKNRHTADARCPVFANAKLAPQGIMSATQSRHLLRKAGWVPAFAGMT